MSNRQSSVSEFVFAEFSLPAKRRNRTVSRGYRRSCTSQIDETYQRRRGFRAAEIAALYRPFDPCIVGSIVLRGNEKRNTKRTTTDAISPASWISILLCLVVEHDLDSGNSRVAPYDGYVTRAYEEKLERVLPQYYVSTIHTSFPISLLSNRLSRVKFTYTGIPKRDNSHSFQLVL